MLWYPIMNVNVTNSEKDDASKFKWHKEIHEEDANNEDSSAAAIWVNLCVSLCSQQRYILTQNHPTFLVFWISWEPTQRLFSHIEVTIINDAQLGRAQVSLLLFWLLELLWPTTSIGELSCLPRSITARREKKKRKE